MMEKWIYVHVLKAGESLEEDKIAGHKDATNDWYVIKPRADGGDEVEMSRVFEEGATLNHPNRPLCHTLCEAIGSSIYVIGGKCVVCEADPRCNYKGSCEIRCIDTQNPKEGWKTCFTLPISGFIGGSAVVDDHWLCVFPYHCHSRHLDPKRPCLAFDVTDKKTVRNIPQPGGFVCAPYLSSCVSPGTLASYMMGDGIIYKLDFSNNGSEWSVHHDHVPYPVHELMYYHSAVDDGIFYLCNCISMKFISFDIREKKERYAVSLPESFWLGFHGEAQIIVLSKDRFCLLSNKFFGVHSIKIFFTRFSVRYDSPESEPYVDVGETQCFPLAGCCVNNYVAVPVDPPADVAKSSRVDMASGDKAVKLD